MPRNTRSRDAQMSGDGNHPEDQEKDHPAGNNAAVVPRAGGRNP